MIFDNMINELLFRFPMLTSIYESEGDYIENLQHPTYGIVFVPYIKQAVLENDENAIQMICDFMESMANSDDEDERVSELLGVSVLENILCERELLSVLKPHLGVETLKLLSLMEKESGWSE